MSLKAIYDKEESIPEGLAEHYTEREGKWELQVSGMKTDADIARVQKALTSERDAHKESKKALGKFSALGEYDDVVGKLDKYPELEAAADGKLDEDKITELAEQRALSRIAPLERKNGELTDLLATAESRVIDFENANVKRTISDAVRSAAIEGKVRPEAIEDVIMYGTRDFKLGEEDGKITNAKGFEPDAWLADLKTTKAYWWPDSVGGGASGGSGGSAGANNPFAKGEFFNRTEQGRMIKEDPEKAKRYARAANVTLP